MLFEINIHTMYSFLSVAGESGPHKQLHCVSMCIAHLMCEYQYQKLSSSSQFSGLLRALGD